MAIASRTTFLPISLVVCTLLIWYLYSSQPWAARYPSLRFQHADSSRTPHIDPLTADLKCLQEYLANGSIKSSQLVDIYLAQIERHDAYLHAMLSRPTIESLHTIAATLDDERAAGKIRGPLHGIPVIIKDVFNTHPSLGMKSTAGSLALENARPSKNARLVEKLIAAGMIILGKANLSELSNCRGVKMPRGWSALGGQAQSAYVRGGVLPFDSKDGHSNPGGSSTGSAVAVAAGFAPISVGSETDGSLINPAGRGSIYTIKPSIGIVSQDGTIPVSHTMDSPGPMGKTPYDIAALLDVLREDTPGFPDGGYTSVLPGASLSQFSVAAVDFTEWIFGQDDMKSEASVTKQMNREFQRVHDTLRMKARSFVENVPLIHEEAASINGTNSLMTVMLDDMRHDFESYLDALEYKPIKDLPALIEFNRQHADVELPPDHDNQKLLEAAAALNLSRSDYEAHLQKLRQVCRTQGIDYILDMYDADVIIGPTDSHLASLASGSGYPIAQMPLSFLDFNGRAFGMVALARQYQEATLIKFLGAWNSEFQPWKPPPMLVKT